MNFLFMLSCSATEITDTQKEWLRYQSGSISIIEDMPEVFNEILTLPNNGPLVNGKFLTMWSGLYYVKVPESYSTQLKPLFQAYLNTANPNITEPLKTNYMFQGGSPKFNVIEEAETNALKILGLDINELLNEDNCVGKTYSFEITGIRSSLKMDIIYGWAFITKNFILIAGSPELDALRASYNLQKKEFAIPLFYQDLGTLN